MTTPNGPAVTVTALRQTLGLSPERPDGVRDVIAVPLTATDPVPDDLAAAPRPMLALGDWPDRWLGAPETAPKYLVALRGPVGLYQIAGIWEIDPLSWGLDTEAPPRFRTVPVVAPAYVASAALAGQILDIGLTFGWASPEEQFAFL